MTFIPDEDYAFIYNRVPRACVDLAIRNESGALLLCLRDIEPHKGLWHLPGGGIKFKETIAEAANRISRKEFGVEVKILRTIGVCEVMNDDLASDKPRHSISVVVEAQIVTGVPQATDETVEARYFTELPVEMNPYHQEFIKENDLM